MVSIFDSNAEKVYKLMNKLCIDYETIEHGPLFTCNDECPEMEGVDVLDIKNLFLKDNKGRKHFLVITPYQREINLKELAKELDVKSLSFASKERLMKYLSVESGAVSIFNLINDEAGEVVLVLDKSVLEPGRVGFHPNVNTQTLIFDSADLKKYLEIIKNDIVYLSD